jgi:hypothetical protein
MNLSLRVECCAVLLLISLTISPSASGQDPDARIGEPESLPWIAISADQRRFVRVDTQTAVTLWGFNYDHDDQGRLIEDYWNDQWEVIEQDFREMKQLGANVVRIHLQVARFMTSRTEPNEASLKQLSRLVELAERQRLYVDLTGLGCYHKADVPAWYERLSEDGRWDVQARFWRAVAKTVAASPAVFCYDLMNEPILPGEEPESDWLAGEFGGKFFVQRLALDLAGRTREEVAKAWVHKMCAAIRHVDGRHLITVGVIPWAQVFPGAKPLFYSPEVSAPLDFVSVHFYPKHDQIAASLHALRVYDIGKPLVIEEIFPLACTPEEAGEFIRASQPFVDGYLSFYWGKTIAEYEARQDMTAAIMAKWLRHYAALAAGARPASPQLAPPPE